MASLYGGFMVNVNSICVYCGSRLGSKKKFHTLAETLGKILSENNIKLIYGGGNVGLMGIIATSVMKNGGKVHGIIPAHLHDVEKPHKNISELTVVDNMHQRKKLMFDHSDAFVILPGSIGTLDETIEIITWRQLKLHDKPIILINTDNYWTPLLALFENIIEHEFTIPETLKLFHVVNEPEEVLPLLESLPKPKIDPKNTLF